MNGREGLFPTSHSHLVLTFGFHFRLSTPLLITMVSNKDYADHFFTRRTTGMFECNYCGKMRRQAPSSGYTNLMSHLSDKHPHYVDDYAEWEQAGGQQLESFGFVSDKATKIFNWMHWVLERNMPLEEVDNELTRSMSKWDSDSSKTLKKYMQLVVRKVEAVIASEMPSSIGLLFDGWTSGSTYFVAIYATYVIKSETRRVLLALAPLLEETDLGADSHIDLIDETLLLFGKDRSCVRFIFGDNCALTKQLQPEWEFHWSDAQVTGSTWPSNHIWKRLSLCLLKSMSSCANYEPRRAVHFYAASRICVQSSEM